VFCSVRVLEGGGDRHPSWVRESWVSSLKERLKSRSLREAESVVFRGPEGVDGRGDKPRAAPRASPGLGSFPLTRVATHFDDDV
jgi:hypothetical protein